MPLTDILIAVPTFLVVLTIIVFVHEMGHFWAARLNGVAVDAFSLGWGKSLIEWRDRSGVRWKVGRWPIGGFVKFRGDENAASLPMTASYEDPAERAAARAQGILQAMPLQVRALVAAAGSLSNFAFAVLAFAALAMIVGRDVEQAGPPEIGWVQE
ncbi:MAG: site-2 protease family protein, partial [Hyphomonadaceae bacterium]|nr:site-2 protease family protein [Hyphomonadaceae bacterium]